MKNTSYVLVSYTNWRRSLSFSGTKYWETYHLNTIHYPEWHRWIDAEYQTSGSNPLSTPYVCVNQNLWLDLILICWLAEKWKCIYWSFRGIQNLWLCYLPDRKLVGGQSTTQVELIFIIADKMNLWLFPAGSWNTGINVFWLPEFIFRQQQ